MLDIPHNNDLTANTWKGGETPAGRTALFCCPKGHIGSLSGHEIAGDGTVSPSVVCPWAGCDFHDYIKLIGWEEVSGM